MLGGRLVGATGCVLLAASVLGGARSAGRPDARWRPLLKVPTIVDVVGPRADGRLVLSTRRGLFLVRPRGAVAKFARGPAGWVATGGEPYVALAPARRLPGRRCSFKRDDVFALDADSTPGVVRVDRAGKRGSTRRPSRRRLSVRDRLRPCRPVRLSTPRHGCSRQQKHSLRNRLPRRLDSGGTRRTRAWRAA